MTYILSSDWHCHSWSQFATMNDGINSRLASIMMEIERQAVEAQKVDAHSIYVAGDIFHVRGSIKPTVFNPIAEMLAYCAKNYEVEFILMPGNHDLESAETESMSSAITSLSAIDGVRVVNAPTIFKEDGVIMIPWHSTREGLTSVIEEMVASVKNPSEYDLILHTGINGVIMGMPDHGWAAEELATFGFGRVFCGHYHNHKSFDLNPTTYGDAGVVSIGATTHQTWSDVGTKAGFLVVDYESFRHVESAAPIFKDFTALEDIDEVKDNFIRVRGIELEESEIRGMREEIMSAGAKGVIIDPLVKRDAHRPDIKASGGVSVEAQISEYSSEHYGDLAGEIEKEAIAILGEVRSVA